MLAGCPEGGTVLDPFSGAATTGIMAIKNNRKYVGIEINAEYIDISMKRYEDTKVASLSALFDTSAEIQIGDSNGSI